MSYIEYLLSSASIYEVLAIMLCGVFTLEALLISPKVAWRIPALFIYFTTAAWYFVDRVYTPETYKNFPSDIIAQSYMQILIFLLAFRILIPLIAKPFINEVKTPDTALTFRPEQILKYLFIVWLGLLAFGIYRMNGDILGALFPISSRAGGHMWSRPAGAGAGASGFIVSMATFAYLLVCAFLGILLPLQTKTSAKVLNFLLLLVVLPYYLFMGARNQLLAVIFPGFLHYLLFSKQEAWKKIVITIFSFLAINYVMALIISFRNEGFAVILARLVQGEWTTPTKTHLGLNMLEELIYINSFIRYQRLEIALGKGYLAELLNFVPRAIWPGKPLLGIDYAILRGFGGGSSDIGVFATLSRGFIGQGVMEFGSWFGPLATALLFSLWGGILSRFFIQSESVLRRCLFLLGLALTFNLGRDITLLVLWPMVFGYVIVRVLEQRQHSEYSARDKYMTSLPPLHIYSRGKRF